MLVATNYTVLKTNQQIHDTVLVVVLIIIIRIVLLVLVVVRSDVVY
jgi:hypothetical protein